MGSVHLGFDDPFGDVLLAVIATSKRSLPAYTKVESPAPIILFIGSHGDPIIQAKRPDGKIHSDSKPKVVVVGARIHSCNEDIPFLRNHDRGVKTVGILIHLSLIHI